MLSKPYSPYNPYNTYNIVQKNKTKLFCIPGFGFHAKLFLQSDLMQNFELVGLDYFNLENHQLDNVATILSRSIANNSIVLGWSLGGLIAVKIAALFPNKVAKLVLVASQPRFLSDSIMHGQSQSHNQNQNINFPTIDNFNKILPYNTKDQGTYFVKLVNYPNRRIHYKKFLQQYFITYNVEAILKQAMQFFHTDLTQDYKSINPSILHIVNQKDGVIKQDEKFLRQLKPDNTVATVQGAGHAGFFTHSNVYNCIIRNFIND